MRLVVDFSFATRRNQCYQGTLPLHAVVYAIATGQAFGLSLYILIFAMKLSERDATTGAFRGALHPRPRVEASLTGPTACFGWG